MCFKGFRISSLLPLAALLCALHVQAWAQTTSVSGEVNDPTSAVVGGTVVKLTDTATKQVLTTMTNQAGRTYTGRKPDQELSRDDITLYWLTGTQTSSARLYWENNANNFNAVDIALPTAITVFPGEIYNAPRSWAEQSYHKLIYFHKVDKGGHFAAWEQPELFADEIRAAFRPLR